MDPLLLMQNVEKSFGAAKALDGVRFEVAAGEVHALIGANGAGKSTPMKILCGELEYENGSIAFAGETIFPGKNCDVRDLGIVMIRQEISVVPVLTVAQYMFLGREPTRGPAIDDRRTRGKTEELLKSVGADFSPDTRMNDLSIAEQQLVEIARALSYPLKLLIMDEPTTAFGERETERVFSVIRRLKAQNVSVIYISHRLEELFTISDRITVMRDGCYITTLDTSATEKSALIRLLAGHDLKTGGSAFRLSLPHPVPFRGRTLRRGGTGTEGVRRCAGRLPPVRRNASVRVTKQCLPQKRQAETMRTICSGFFFLHFRRQCHEPVYPVRQKAGGSYGKRDPSVSGGGKGISRSRQGDSHPRFFPDIY